MAGHSKWANIKFRKERMDAKKSKAFSRLVKEITVAARIGGGDPESNPRLRLALEKAKRGNLPADNVQRAIKRGTGEMEGVQYEEIRYEGFGPQGTAFIVECTTDNRNRCVAEVRRAFTKYGGNLATSGAVAPVFERCGLFLFPASAGEDEVVTLGAEHDVLDLDLQEDGSITVKTAPEQFLRFKAAAEEAGLEPDHAELTMLPLVEVDLDEAGKRSVSKMLGELEILDDTDQVYVNAAVED